MLVGPTVGVCAGPEGFVCPDCGVSGEPWTMSDKLLRCRSCHGRTSLTAGTLFDGTRKPLRIWFMAMWFVTSQKNGVSALGLQRVLGLGSYETAIEGPGLRCDLAAISGAWLCRSQSGRLSPRDQHHERHHRSCARGDAACPQGRLAIEALPGTGRTGAPSALWLKDAPQFP
jgi:hypothetical protein